jgi:hypothetical protein
MSIGTALVVIAVLVLAVYSAGFRKFLVGCVVVGGLAVGLYLYHGYKQAPPIDSKDVKWDPIDVQRSLHEVTSPALLAKLKGLGPECAEAVEDGDALRCTKQLEYTSVDRTCRPGYEEVPAVGLPKDFIPDQARCRLKQ